MNQLRIGGLFLILLGALIIPLPQGSALAADGLDCRYYAYQEDAQQSYEDYENTHELLDPDGDGIACNDLPHLPTGLEGTRKSEVQSSSGFPVLNLDGYYGFSLTLAGIDGSVPRNLRSKVSCAELLSPETLDALLPYPSEIYWRDAEGRTVARPKSAMADVSAVGFAWVLNDGQPVSVNEWIIRNGFGLVDASVLSPQWQNRLQKAQEKAEVEGLGVWGKCKAPRDYAITGGPADPQVIPTPNGQLAQETHSGDQAISFALETEGNYQFTLDVISDVAVFVAIDVYAADGTWIPELSMSTAQGGKFTSMAYLYAGEYHFQVKAVGSWRVTIEKV